jgi:protein-S-isoprenylcysteine O-methyltransferase Ste14
MGNRRKCRLKHKPLSRVNLTIRVLGLLLLVFPLFGAMFFLPAGTLSYWEAWVYLAVLFVPMVLALVYFLIFSPALLERRMRMREKEAEQQLIVKLASIVILLVYLLPGFDHRFHWSSVPIWLVAIADILVLSGYALMVLVMRENPYAGRTIEVEPDQTVVTTGPYAFVRHPMYLGILLLFVFSPLALGSYWSMIPVLFLMGLLIARITNEERVLLKELNGYREYTEKVKWRLIPGIW